MGSTLYNPEKRRLSVYMCATGGEEQSNRDILSKKISGTFFIAPEGRNGTNN